MNKKRIFSSLVLLIFVSNNLFAAAGTTVFNFLKLPKNAEQAALANLTTFNTNLSFVNPAVLGFTDHYNIQASKAIHFQNTGYNSFNFAMPYNDFGFSLSYFGFDYGKFDKYLEDSNGDYIENGTFGAADSCMQVSAGYRIIDILSLGAGVKYIFTNIDNIKMNGLVFDLSAFLLLSDKWSLALGLENLGAKVDGYMLPSSVYLSYTNKIIKPCQLGLELKSFFDNTMWLKTAIEVGVGENFVLRGGYNWALTNSNSSLGSWYQRNLSLGFALKVNVISIDYAWLPYGDLGNCNIISLKVVF
ncbi:MAG: hypothetical protein LBJ79_03430 [Endomicrobium sp.]|jgi:hypothetical protein|nr:hypothetical protein [Endomicrobium sp.]